MGRLKNSLHNKSKLKPAPAASRCEQELYSGDDCSYFGLVLIQRNEVWWIPFTEIRGKSSVCTNIEHDSLAEYRGNIDGLKKCDENCD